MDCRSGMNFVSRPMPLTKPDFDARLERALEILAATGMRRTSYAPGVHRLLWHYGVRLRPPHFASFTSNILFMGGGFGAFWGAIMWLLVWGPAGVPLSEILLHAAVAGGVFGLVTAGYFRFSARRYNLPAWEDVMAKNSAFD